MPRTTPIAEIFELDHKETVTLTRGTLTKLFPRKAGESSAGPWSIQKGEITDGKTTIAVMFKDREEVPQSWRHRDILIECHKGEKGFSGVYAEDDNYKGTVTRILKVTKTGEVSITDGSAPAEPQPAAASADYREAWPDAPESIEPAPVRRRDPEPHVARTHDPDRRIKDAKASIMQIANLHLICSLSVKRFEVSEYKRRTGEDMPESFQQGAIGSIFIQATRAGLHNTMPTHPLRDDDA